MMLALLVSAVTNRTGISPLAYEKHRRGLEKRGLIDLRGVPTKEGVEYLQRPYKKGNE